MIQNWTEKSQVFIVALIISIVTIFLGWFFGSWLLTAGLIFTVISIITLARHVWLSDKSNYLLRAAMITLDGAALINTSFGLNLVANLILYFFPNANLPTNGLDPVTLGFLLIITLIVFYFTNDNSKQSAAQKPIDKLVEGLTIKQKWENVCEGLKAQIRDIDRDTNWSNEYYTPLDAEVEMRTSKGIKRVIADLLGAIKQSNDRLFLLIGEPGSGKSVSLRKLCLDLLKNSVKKEYIPIYVNLKEWESDKDWSKTPPTWQDLEAFVKESLQNKDRHLADFFEKYYDVLDENGNLFFVLDSFDEIPQVLGTNANSKLITDLTKVCREFLVGAKQPRSRGILASREHRMPHEEYLDNCTILRVRPFTHEKIELTLTQAGRMGVDAVAQLFRSRPDLTPILRNPFMTSLLQSYLANNDGQLPKNQAELYADYIKKSIQQAQKRLGKESIPFEEIHEQAVKMATAIFSTDNLQAPLEELRQVAAHPKFDDIVQVLRFTRIARGNTSSGNVFSFSHRRFYEYFVVCDWLNNPELDIPIASIPVDSKWRDALVLYCEVAPLSKARDIAFYCIKEIGRSKNITDLNAKYCLRFLAEAFKGRLECLNEIRPYFGKFILSQIHQDNDPISIKLAVEALGILDKNHIDKGTMKAFRLWDTYIYDTAIRSCRHLDSISENLELTIISLIDDRFSKNKMWGISVFFKRSNKLDQIMSRKELIFSLSLSEAFNNIRLVLAWHKIEEKIKFGHQILMLFYVFSTVYILTHSPAPENSVPKSSNFQVLLIILPALLLVLNLFVVEPLLRRKYFNKSNALKRLIFIFPTRLNFSSFFARFLPTLAVIFTLFLIVFFVSKLAQLSFIESFYFTIAGFHVVFFLFFLFIIPQLISIHLRRLKFYKSINFNNLNKREYIADVLSNTTWFFHSLKIISYLENNIKEVTGKFPDNFLKVGKGQIMSRLIRLEVSLWASTPLIDFPEMG